MHACLWVFTSSVLAPRGGESGGGGGNAADLHVGEGAPSLAAAVRDRGGGGDDVLQPVEGDDEQRQQEHQQAEEEPHVHVNVGLMCRGGGSRRHGGRRRGQTEESPVVDRSDAGLIMVHQQDVHPWHPGWRGQGEGKEQIYCETSRNFNINYSKKKRNLQNFSFFVYWSCQKPTSPLQDSRRGLTEKKTLSSSHKLQIHFDWKLKVKENVHFWIRHIIISRIIIITLENTVDG